MMARKAFGFELGRLRLGTIPFVASNRQTLDLASGIPKDYFIWAIIARLQYRLGISGGTTNGTVTAQAPVNLVERFEISGNHKIFGDWSRLLLQGDHVFNMAKVEGNFAFENTSSPALSGAVGNYDESVTFYIHLAPPNVRPEEQLLYLLDPPLWNSLNLFVDWGKAASLISGGDRTLALTAFGSGTGNPILVITRIIAKLKGDRFKLNPIPVKQTYRSVKIETTFQDTFIDKLNVGNFLRNLFLVTGTRATGGSLATVGDNFLTQSDALLTRIRIKKDDVPTRDIEWVPNQQHEGRKRALAFSMPTGYNPVEWVEDETSASAFDTRSIALNNLRLELFGDVSGATDQRLHLIQTEFAGIPVFRE